MREVKLFPDKFKVPKNVSKKQLNIARKVVRNMVSHFKKDGWDLSASFQTGEFVYEILGYDIYVLFLALLKNKNIILKLTDKHGLVFSKEKKERKRRAKSKNT